MHGHEQASPVESPISLIFGGRSRSIIRAPGTPDAITTKVWRSLKLQIQVRFSSFSHFHRRYVLVTNFPNLSRSTIRLTPFKMHSHTSRCPDWCRLANPAQARRANRCKSRRFHLFSSSILSASCTMRPQMPWLRSVNQFSSPPSLKSHQVQLFYYILLVSSKAKDPSWPGLFRNHGTCR